MNKLQRATSFSLIALLILLIIPMVLAWQSLEQIYRNAERSSIANQILVEHLILGINGEKLLNHLSAGGLRNDAQGAILQKRIHDEASQIRRHIAAEIEIIGQGGAGEEAEEFERVDRIANAVSIMEAGGNANTWRQDIEYAIADERAEIEKLNLENAGALNTVRTTLVTTLIGTASVLLLGLMWLRRQIISPTFTLMQGMHQLMAGDRSHRIKPSGLDPVKSLHKIFNNLAEQLSVSAQSEDSSRKSLEEAVASSDADLRKANAELIRSAEQRTQFLADISHELRTPLAIIGGEADVTLRNNSATIQDHRQSLMRVRDQARSMTRLVSDIMTMAHNEASSMTMQFAPLDLLRLIEATAQSLRPLLIADQGSLVFTPIATEAQISGDEGRLRQLLIILLDNAIKYSDASPKITVTLDRAPHGFAIAIADEGVGIDAADLPLVFERFQRCTSGQERNAEGAGLGLALARSIAESHGGSISIASAAGTGACISIFLPEAAGVGEGKS